MIGLPASCIMLHIEIAFTVFFKLGTRLLLPQADRIWSRSLVSLWSLASWNLSWQQVLLQRLCLLSSCCQFTRSSLPLLSSRTSASFVSCCFMTSATTNRWRFKQLNENISQCSKVGGGRNKNKKHIRKWRRKEKENCKGRQKMFSRKNVYSYFEMWVKLLTDNTSNNNYMWHILFQIVYIDIFLICLIRGDKKRETQQKWKRRAQNECHRRK